MYSHVYSAGTIYWASRPRIGRIWSPACCAPPRSATQEFLDPASSVGPWRVARSALSRGFGRRRYYVKGYLWTQDSTDWPSMVNALRTLFGARDVLGYNQCSSAGYSVLLSRDDRLYTFYNASVID